MTGDASFANKSYFILQLGISICLVKSTAVASIDHYNLASCKHTERNQFAFELFKFVHGFELGVAILHLLKSFLGGNVSMKKCTDLESLFGVFKFLKITFQKQL